MFSLQSNRGDNHLYLVDHGLCKGEADQVSGYAGQICLNNVLRQMLGNVFDKLAGVSDL